MKVSNARMHFEQAIEIAKADNNQAAEQIARGMLDMLSALTVQLNRQQALLEKIQRQTN